MKRGTPDHPKTMELMDLLSLRKYQAVGILETLWQWCARYAIRGDVGRWSDASIARAVDWDREPGELVDAMVESGWLDRVDGDARLVIHDIYDHADNGWRQNLVDAGLTFWDGTPARKPAPERIETPSRKTPSKLQKNSRRTPEELQPASNKTPQPVSVAGSREPEPEAITATAPTASAALEVFDHWRVVMGHPSAKFEAKRRRAVDARLREGYTPDQLKAAVSGCRESPHHRGENDRQTVYDDLELICRTGAKVEWFGAMVGRAPRAPPMTEKAQARQDAANAMIEGGRRWKRDQQSGLGRRDGGSSGVLQLGGSVGGDGAPEGGPVPGGSRLPER